MPHSSSETSGAINESACQAIPWGKSCEKGHWCCLNENSNSSTCTPCKNTDPWWGHCLDRPNETCQAHGYKAWNDLADLEDYVYNYATDAIKAKLCSKYQSLPFCSSG